MKLNKAQKRALAEQRAEFDAFASRLSKGKPKPTRSFTSHYTLESPRYTATINSNVKIVKSNHDHLIDSQFEQREQATERELKARAIAEDRNKQVTLVVSKGNYQLPSAIDDPNAYGTKR